MENHNKMVLAVIQEADYDETVQQLNKNGFFVTKLSSTGGFLRKKNTTIMVGVQEDKVQMVLDIIKEKAGRRRETVYTMPAPVDDVFSSGVSSSIPVETDVGGATVFTMDIDSLNKF